jgi:hypothetical protein
VSGADGSRQFRALMVRLKPLAHMGIGDSYVEFARRLDIRPKKPSHRNRYIVDWCDAKIGRIALSLDIISEVGKSPNVIISNERLAMTHDRARAVFQSLFGNSDIHHSASGKGWWMSYVPPEDGALQLIATFDNASKKEPRALFSGAMLMPKDR